MTKRACTSLSSTNSKLWTLFLQIGTKFLALRNELDYHPWRRSETCSKQACTTVLIVVASAELSDVKLIAYVQNGLCLWTAQALSGLRYHDSVGKFNGQGSDSHSSTVTRGSSAT